MKCAVHSIHHVLGKQWSLKIIDELYFSKELSFGELKKKTKGITSKLLSGRLSEFVSEGVVQKKQSGGSALQLRYSLTKKGSDLHFVLTKMKEWGMSEKVVPSDCSTNNCNSCQPQQISIRT